MAITYNRYVFNEQTFHTETDIPYTTTIVGEAYGASYVVYDLQELEAWAFDASCDCPQYNPTQTIPPSPPVYPILFSSDIVYGREHFSVDLKMIRQDTYSRTLNVIQDGQYFDLTDCDIRMTFKWAYTDDDADAVFVLTTDTDDGIVITSPTTGEFVFTILPEDTEDLPAHTVRLLYDAQVTDTQGNVYTVAIGHLMVVPDVSTVVP